MVIGAGFLLLVLWFLERKRLPRSPTVWVHLAVSAAVANAIPYLLFTVAEQEISSSSAGIINCTTPLWTMIIAWVSGQESGVRDARRVGGMLVGFLGCMLIFSPWRTGSDIMSLGGLECLIASMFLAMGYVYMARFLANRGDSPLMLSACQLTAASALLAPALLAEGLSAPHLRVDALVALGILGLLGTGAAYILNYRIISDHGSVAASVVTYLLPVVSIILGTSVLGEHLTPTMLAGMITVFAGVAFTSARPAASGRGRSPQEVEATIMIKNKNG
jgi:drug/metabolite transporter (DMT)-like permease